MKRLHILNTPTSVTNLADIDTDVFNNAWQLKAERLEIRRLRQFKRQLA